MRQLALILITALLAIAANAQTTYIYTVPARGTCWRTLNGCTLHDLTTSTPIPTFPGGATPYGYFVGGSTLGATFAFQIYQGYPAAGSTGCTGANGAYTQTPRPDLGPTYVEWQVDCASDTSTNGGGSGELGNVGPYHITVDLIASSALVLVRVGRSYQWETLWTISDGTVTLTPQ